MSPTTTERYAIKKGTAISLDFIADEATSATITRAVDAVRAKYADKRASACGWHGTAVVNIAGKDEATSGLTYLVKGLKDGWDVFGLLGSVTDTIKVEVGTFESA